MKILTAESERETINDITTAFNKCLPYWQLVTTDSGKGCLNIVKGNCPDIVILSLELVDMCGFDVIELLHDYFKVPVMVLSCIRDTSALVEAFNAGADGYMSKPIHSLELMARVKAMLRWQVLPAKSMIWGALA
jgi:DNA-binding response OmpR family regulator